MGIPQARNFRANDDALIVARAQRSGAVLLGKTNVPIVLGDWQSYNAIYGVTRNPWDLLATDLRELDLDTVDPPIEQVCHTVDDWVRHVRPSVAVGGWRLRGGLHSARWRWSMIVCASIDVPPLLGPTASEEAINIALNRLIPMGIVVAGPNGEVNYPKFA